MTPILCRRLMWLCLLLTAASMPARATPVPYTLDQRYATIGFTTSGLIGTQGYFRKFSGHLALETSRRPSTAR